MFSNFLERKRFRVKIWKVQREGIMAEMDYFTTCDRYQLGISLWGIKSRQLAMAVKSVHIRCDSSRKTTTTTH
jgi:hypothetical protein